MSADFEHAHVLFGLLVLAGLYILYARYNSGKKKTILRFSSLEIIEGAIPGRSLLRRHLPFVLLMSVLALTIMGLANPQIRTATTEVGITLSIVLDGSESMTASDYEPTRLDAAKEAISKLVDGLGSNSNTGIILFESGARTISYLSPDKQRALKGIESIEYSRGATAIGDGIVLGVDMVSSIPDRKNIIILLSDGVYNSGFATPEEAVGYAKAASVQIHTIGLGSEEPVFLRDDMYGEPQYAELDESLLHMISEQTGGRYFKSIDGQTLDEILQELGRGPRVRGSVYVS